MARPAFSLFPTYRVTPTRGVKSGVGWLQEEVSYVRGLVDLVVVRGQHAASKW